MGTLTQNRLLGKSGYSSLFFEIKLDSEKKIKTNIFKVDVYSLGMTILVLSGTPEEKMQNKIRLD